jgi:hypothetical protein
MDFKHYYAALLRHGSQTEPRADEAIKDYRAMLIRIQAGGMF